ncbi:hypothetical protein RCO27_02580 [Sphingosinicella sp. LHD-64]|uniref:hypothetical protein n=1 Tax=Sphingosinicella sp. LHD-64 TaxID=3072139 RepID=UPI0028106A1B|nr:hypothetical protein [Sphingosinicella sp. LHD-64]MDQ8755105.1 hypothetical protein [Sphingosinicella sp. LHD-64]
MDDERPIERETTIVQTGNGGGGSGVIIAIVFLFLVGAIAFFFFGGYFEGETDKVDVSVNVVTPKIDLPDIRIEPPQQAQPTNATTN